MTKLDFNDQKEKAFFLRDFLNFPDEIVDAFPKDAYILMSSDNEEKMAAAYAWIESSFLFNDDLPNSLCAQWHLSGAADLFVSVKELAVLKDQTTEEQATSYKYIQAQLANAFIKVSKYEDDPTVNLIASSKNSLTLVEAQNLLNTCL